jgi:Holliday junction resolvase-like predicted endonuclease
MTFQSRFIKEKEKEGYLVLKTIRLNKTGFPDIILLKKNICIFVELKEGKDTLKPLQKLRIDELRAQGFDAYCLHETNGKIY